MISLFMVIPNWLEKDFVASHRYYYRYEYPKIRVVLKLLWYTIEHCLNDNKLILSIQCRYLHQRPDI